MIAWTGGTKPSETDKRKPEFKSLRHFAFRESLRDCGGLDLWACAGTSALQRARIFWNRANLDAWRTMDSVNDWGV